MGGAHRKLPQITRNLTKYAGWTSCLCPLAGHNIITKVAVTVTCQCLMLLAGHGHAVTASSTAVASTAEPSAADGLATVASIAGPHFVIVSTADKLSVPVSDNQTAHLLLLLSILLGLLLLFLSQPLCFLQLLLFLLSDHFTAVKLLGFLLLMMSPVLSFWCYC